MAINAVEAVRPVGMPHYSAKPTRAWMSGRSSAAAGPREGVFSKSGALALKNKRLARNNNKFQPFTATSVTTVEEANPQMGDMRH
jgi:hypothetical protein